MADTARDMEYRNFNFNRMDGSNRFATPPAQPSQWGRPIPKRDPLMDAHQDAMDHEMAKQAAAIEAQKEAERAAKYGPLQEWMK